MWEIQGSETRALIHLEEGERDTHTLTHIINNNCNRGRARDVRQKINSADAGSGRNEKVAPFGGVKCLQQQN